MIPGNPSNARARERGPFAQGWHDARAVYFAGSPGDALAHRAKLTDRQAARVLYAGAGAAALTATSCTQLQAIAVLDYIDGAWYFWEGES